MPYVLLSVRIEHIRKPIFSVNDVGTIKRSICECDHQLAQTLKDFVAPNEKYQEYSITKCQKQGRSMPNQYPSCCESTEGFFQFYFGSRSCCEQGGAILSVGECLLDAGKPYEAKVTLIRPEYIHVGSADGKPNGGNNADATGNGNGSGKGKGNKDPNKWATGASALEGNLIPI